MSSSAGAQEQQHRGGKIEEQQHRGGKMEQQQGRQDGGGGAPPTRVHPPTHPPTVK